MRMFNVASMSFNAILENKILAKISGFTVFIIVCFQYALPYLRKTKGSIVNISSLAGSCGADKSVTYCATKASI